MVQASIIQLALLLYALGITAQTLPTWYLRMGSGNSDSMDSMCIDRDNNVLSPPLK